MAMCPQCPRTGLRHTLLLNDIPAHSCPDCDGVLLSLVVYRRWREQLAPEIESVSANGNLVPDNTVSISCPKCRALMTKYRFSVDAPNRLDFCAHCEDVWFDSGEWDLVANIAAQGQLAEIFAQPWQFRLQKQTQANMEAHRMRELLAADYDEFIAFRRWLHSHPARDRLLALLALPDTANGITRQ